MLVSYLGSDQADGGEWHDWKTRVRTFLLEARSKPMFRPDYETMKKWLAAYHARVLQDMQLPTQGRPAFPPGNTAGHDNDSSEESQVKAPTSRLQELEAEDPAFWHRFMEEDFGHHKAPASLGNRPFPGFRAARRYGLL